MLRFFLKHPIWFLYGMLSEHPLTYGLIGEGISVAVLLYYLFKIWKKKQPMRKRDVLILSFTLMFLEIFHIDTSAASKAGYWVGF